MCYIQLSLYGIPAVVIHGNSLTTEEWSRWYTPVYIVGGWSWKNRRLAKKREEQEKQLEKPLEEKSEKALEESQPEFTLPTPQEAIKAYEQLNLFG